MLSLAATFARTPPGRVKVRGLFPAPTESEARARQAETAEGGILFARDGRLPLTGAESPEEALASLSASGSFGAPEDYRRLLALARAAAHVAAVDIDAEELPHLSRMIRALPDLSGIAVRGARMFEPDGTLSDAASPQLAQLRGQLRRERDRIYRAAQSWLLAHPSDAGGDTVVQRQGRYCVPVSPSAAGRVSGIVHDRSASGATVFLEPLELSAGNNALSLLAADARREEERLLRELGGELLARAPELATAADILGELDGIEARASFGRTVEAAAPEFSHDGGWELSGARHPLLDAHLRGVRESVFGPEPASRDAVPLEVEIAPEKKCLLVSGPNAGGKTVVAKTLGLFSMLAQCGFPLPARRARLPVFSSFFVSIGDEQEILTDRSTFSSAMRCLAGILREARPGALGLFDELGSGTDPDEGGAIAIAALESFLAAGGRAVVTTHLSSIKDHAAGDPLFEIAAMEFDEASGHSTYRLRKGLLGRSRALATAREEGVPRETLERAREILGQGWARREVVEAEAEEALARLRQLEREATEARDRAAEQERRLSSEREKFELERRRILAESRESVERARRSLRAASSTVVDEIRREKLSAAQAARRLAQVESAAAAEPAVREAEEMARAAGRQVRLGDAVRMRGSTVSAQVVELEGDSAWVLVLGKRFRVATSELTLVEGGGPKRKEGAIHVPEPEAIPSEVHVIGRTVEEAIEEVDRAIDMELRAGGETLRVVHGHGTGRLRAGLREHLRRHAAVASLRPGAQREGGNGATVVTLK